MIAKLPPPPPSILSKIKLAAPPPRFPKGYFDSLMSPTRELLDRCLTIAQAADWWVSQGVIRPEHRQKFMDAMHGRLSRLKRQKTEGGEVFRWMESPYYDSVHLVAAGKTIALCGSKTALWSDATSLSQLCSRCLGISRRQNISIAD